MKKGHLTSPDVDSDPDPDVIMYSDLITDVRDGCVTSRCPCV